MAIVSLGGYAVGGHGRCRYHIYESMADIFHASHYPPLAQQVNSLVLRPSGILQD